MASTPLQYMGTCGKDQARKLKFTLPPLIRTYKLMPCTTPRTVSYQLVCDQVELKDLLNTFRLTTRLENSLGISHSPEGPTAFSHRRERGKLFQECPELFLFSGLERDTERVRAKKPSYTRPTVNKTSIITKVFNLIWMNHCSVKHLHAADSQNTHRESALLTNQISEEKVVDLLSDPGHHHKATNDGQEVLERRDTHEHYIIDKTGSPRWNSDSIVCIITVPFPPASSCTEAKSADCLHNRRGGEKGKSHYTNWGWFDSKIKLYVNRSLSLFEYWGELDEMKVILLINAVMKRKWKG